MNYLIVILEFDAEAQAYSASCPDLNNVSSFGKTRDEAIANLKEAIALYLDLDADEEIIVTIKGSLCA